MTTLTFPRDFVWGTATASYQIEGAWNEDGRSESIWDRFAHTPGKIEDGSNGDVACDHYHRWREDIALMKQLGMRAYRFSIAWPRILPQGRDEVNQKGLDFYSQLVDELLANDIEPFVTLYHWDLPQALQDEGGWTVRSTAEAFAAYADVMSRDLGDRVKNWITHNEPWCASMLSYQLGIHAPGLQDWPAAIAASHHLLLSHGLAVPIIRRNSPDAEVGITLNFSHAMPASPSDADYQATRLFDGYYNRWFIDPIYGRRYPADIVAYYTAQGYLPNGEMPFVQPGDFAIIAAPTDFLGINYYTRELIQSASSDNTPQPVSGPPSVERTAMDWEIYPEGLYRLLVRMSFEYQIPKLYVTENGASYPQGPDANGQVDDQRRVSYLRDHFAAVHRAIEAGVPLAGFFVWSLMDNFEWAKGYAQRFGIVWVDYDTQQRIPKQSAHWYGRVIASNTVEVDD